MLNKLILQIHKLDLANFSQNIAYGVRKKLLRMTITTPISLLIVEQMQTLKRDIIGMHKDTST